MSISPELNEEVRANPPIVDVIQDHPAAWDWRIVVTFVGFAVCAFYVG